MKRTLRITLGAILTAIGVWCSGMVVWVVVVLAEPDFFGWLCFMCERDECGWAEKNCGIGSFAAAGAFQAVVLAGMVGAVLLASRVMRSGDSSRPQTVRAKWRRGTIAWAFGVAIIALVDLGIYIVDWVRWAHCRVEEHGERFVFPAERVVTGTLVALAVAGATATLAVYLWRRGRRVKMANPTPPATE